MKFIILVLIFSFLYKLNCKTSESPLLLLEEGLEIDQEDYEKDKKMQEDVTDKVDLEEEPSDKKMQEDVSDKVDLKEDPSDKKMQEDVLDKVDMEEDPSDKKMQEDVTDKLDLEEDPSDKKMQEDVLDKGDLEEDPKNKNDETAELCAACGDEADETKKQVTQEEPDKVDSELTKVIDYKLDGKYSGNKAKGVINYFPGGNRADLFGTNQHYKIPANYEDFGRRFILQYPYREKKSADEEAEDDLHNTVQQYIRDKQDSQGPIPVKAPPKFVLDIAKKSAILEASKPKNPTDDIIQKDILRSGNYWNDVWKEEIDPKRILRASQSKNNLDSVTVKIKPGSKLYSLISMLKDKSPRLLYVINKDYD